MLSRLSKIENMEFKLVDLAIGDEEEGKKGITMDLFNKKLEELLKQKEKINKELSNYGGLAHKSLISLKDLVLLMSRLPEIYQSSNLDEKRKILKLIFSNMRRKRKNPLFSIRKPLEIVLSGGFNQFWLGRQDSNLRMSAPKADALPLGDTPSV